MSELEGRGLAWLSPFVVAMVVAAACGQAETNAQTNVPSPAAGSRSSVAQAATRASGGQLVLEFDLPEEFRTQPAGSGNAVTGFRVGFFSGRDSTPVQTFDVAREALTVNARTARLTVSRENVPACAADCVIRVQTLSRAQVSAWSEPVPFAGSAATRPQVAPQAPAPAQPPRVARADRPPNTAPRQRRPSGLDSDELKKYPALSDALRKLLPADAKLETELGRFRRVQDLALVVVISRDYDIPFATLNKTIAGPPRIPPRDALTKLRSDVDARDAVRKSREEVRKLIGMEESREPR